MLISLLWFLCYALSFCSPFCEEEGVLGAEHHEYPTGHLKYYNVQHTHKYCRKSQPFDEKKDCWGYEDWCVHGSNFQYPQCLKDGDRKVFWEQGDFGYVKNRLDSMKVLCQAEDESGTQLECSENWEYCRAKNLYLDLRRKDFEGNDRFVKEYLGKNEIGGSCKVQKHFISEKVRIDGELNSWNADLRLFSSIENMKEKCDVVVKKPTIFMKLDSGVNLYHHFCDFLNLYASQHINGSFSTDVNIVIWDTSPGFHSELFEVTWNAFTKHQRGKLADYKGQRICFEDVMFSMPPRMLHGLYYNTLVRKSCHGSKLFAAFSEHVIHRLGVRQDDYHEDVVRVTLIKRSTKFRKILNEDELIGAMKRIGTLNVTAVDYKYGKIPFIDQVKHSYNSDILIGMHGAGLTHMLFQPNWGAVFEIYNTEDPDCYKDLANLRGVEYFTWENNELLFQQDKGHHPQLGDHAKFTNYAFNVDEFMRILGKAVKGVLNRRK